MSREEMERVLRRTGFTPERIDEISAQLPDPIDLERDKGILYRLGLSRELLMDLLGGSP
jgi:hypothetical protein